MSDEFKPVKLYKGDHVRTASSAMEQVNLEWNGYTTDKALAEKLFAEGAIDTSNLPPSAGTEPVKGDDPEAEGKQAGTAATPGPKPSQPAKA